MASLESPNSTSQTDKSLYIIDLKRPDERLEIQFVPDEILMTGKANHATIQVVGRNNPIYHYVNGQDTMNFELDFYSDEENKEDVMKKVRWIQSLRYNDGYTRRKQNVLIVWGDLFKDQNLVWIVEDVRVRLRDFNSDHGFLPQQAYVNVSFALDPKVNTRESDIRP